MDIEKLSLSGADDAFAEACRAAIPVWREAADAVRSFAEAWAQIARHLALQPSQRYAQAGHPYGNNTRGKKRWLLEEKRRRFYS